LFLPVVTDPEYHYEAINIETQQNNPSSMLWWTKRMLAMRRRYQVFGRGSMEFIHPENRRILTFLRRHEEQCLLIVANLSRFAQYVELDLSAFRGSQLVELFGATPFPPIREDPYVLTLGPHGFYWFSIEPPRSAALGPASPDAVAVVSLKTDWTEALEGRGRATLQRALASFLGRTRRDGARTRTLRSCDIVERVPVQHDGTRSIILLVRIGYTEGEPDMLSVPLSFAEGERAAALADSSPEAVVARLAFSEAQREGVLYDAAMDENFASALYQALARRRRLRGDAGVLQCSRAAELRRIEAAAQLPFSGKVLRAEQSNTVLVYQDASGRKSMLLKWFRRLDPGTNPELEISRVLSQQQFTQVVPPLAGAIEYRPTRGEPCTVAILHGFVPNEGSAWSLTLDAIGEYFERVVAHGHEVNALPEMGERGDLASPVELPEQVSILIGPYLDSARILGQRTAELHSALAASDQPGFAPEPFTDFYRRGLLRDMTSELGGAFRQLRRQVARLPEETRRDAERLVPYEGRLAERLQLFLDRRLTANRIRIHGDLHLGQILYTGKDFVIVDFEGDPTRAISERRIKRSALRDVAGLLRSFHYASEAALRGDTPGGVPRELDRALLERAADLWFRAVSAVFLEAYLTAVAIPGLLPKTQAELPVMLNAYLIHKAAYELNHELNDRPDWASIPIRGLLRLAESAV
jgi:maltose alpha-D-glucosyltransferase/alpha-amylase